MRYMSTPIGKFRNSMTKFLEKLEEWAKDNHEQAKALEKFKLSYDMGMRVNPRDSICFFIKTIEPYADHIMSGDDAYFLGNHIDVDDEYHDLSQQLKQWWPELENYQHEYIKNTFKLLLMLAAIAVRHEGLKTVINRYRSADNQLVY